MNLVKVAGFVHDLRVGEKFLTEADYHKQGLATVAIGTALGQAMPGGVLLAGSNGIKMYSIQFRINNKLYQTAFTGLHFQNGDYVIVAYDQDDHSKAYAVLNPNNGILSMPFDTGYSGKINTKKSINLFTFSFVSVSIVILVFNLIFGTFYLYIYTVLLLLLLILLLPVISYLHIKQKQFCILSENIFSILGFNNIEGIDLSIHEVESDLNNMQNFDFNYRKAVDYDPYPPESIPKKEL